MSNRPPWDETTLDGVPPTLNQSVTDQAISTQDAAEVLAATRQRRKAAEEAARQRLARLAAEREALEEAARQRLLELAGDTIRPEELEGVTSQTLRLKAIEELARQQAAADQAARWAREAQRLKSRTTGVGPSVPASPVMPTNPLMPIGPETSPSPPASDPVVGEPTTAEPSVDEQLVSDEVDDQLSDREAVQEALRLSAERAAKERAQLARISLGLTDEVEPRPRRRNDRPTLDLPTIIQEEPVQEDPAHKAPVRPEIIEPEPIFFEPEPYADPDPEPEPAADLHPGIGLEPPPQPEPHYRLGAGGYADFTYGRGDDAEARLPDPVDIESPTEPEALPHDLDRPARDDYTELVFNAPSLPDMPGVTPGVEPTDQPDVPPDAYLDPPFHPTQEPADLMVDSGFTPDFAAQDLHAPSFDEAEFQPDYDQAVADQADYDQAVADQAVADQADYDQAGFGFEPDPPHYYYDHFVVDEDYAEQAYAELIAQEEVDVPGGSRSGSRDITLSSARAGSGEWHANRWVNLGIGVLLGAMATAVFFTTFTNRDDADTTAQATVAAEPDTLTDPADTGVTTAAIEQWDMVEKLKWIGDLRAGQEMEIGGTEGRVTTSVAAGTRVERGDVVAGVAGEPVILLYGPQPLRSQLADGFTGEEVWMLESNLVALGYDPDRELKIDELFTSVTEDMVKRWQQDIGREATGVVNPGDVVVVPGPSSIVEAAEVGAPTDANYLNLLVETEVLSVAAASGGEVEGLPSQGTPLANGQTLYRQGDVEAIIVHGDDPVTRVITTADYLTEDLERALVEGGYEDEAIGIDSLMTASTMAAIQRWQVENGLPVHADLQKVVYVSAEPEQVFAGHLAPRDGQNDIPVLFLSTSKRIVSVTVPIDDAAWFTGDGIMVVSDDGAEIRGRVVDIITDATTARNGDEQTVTVLLMLSGGENMPVGQVSVEADGRRADAALVVPDAAISSPALGVYEITVASESGATRTLEVEIGLRGDGHTQVISEELAAGDRVIVPG